MKIQDGYIVRKIGTKYYAVSAARAAEGGGMIALNETGAFIWDLLKEDTTVEAVAKAGLFNGTSANTFSPEADTTRGQLMTVLARLSGAKAATIEEGVAWAVANGVSDGTNPEAKITREQLVTMLYRYTGSPAVTGDLSAYTDAASVSAWAKDAMTWAVSNGIVKGVTETTLVPGANATRAQVATIMQRYAGL